MSNDGRKLSYSERDRLRREGGGQGGGRGLNRQQRALEAERSRLALESADALFSGEQGGEAGKALAAAVREAHGTPGLAEACRSYLAEIGLPTAPDLASIFLDAGDKTISVSVLDALLAQKAKGALEIGGGLKRQIRILSEDFDDDLASRAEELLE